MNLKTENRGGISSFIDRNPLLVKPLSYLDRKLKEWRTSSAEPTLFAPGSVRFWRNVAMATLALALATGSDANPKKQGELLTSAYILSSESLIPGQELGKVAPNNSIIFKRGIFIGFNTAENIGLRVNVDAMNELTDPASGFEMIDDIAGAIFITQEPMPPNLKLRENYKAKLVDLSNMMGYFSRFTQQEGDKASMPPIVTSIFDASDRIYQRNYGIAPNLYMEELSREVTRDIFWQLYEQSYLVRGQKPPLSEIPADVMNKILAAKPIQITRVPYTLAQNSAARG